LFVLHFWAKWATWGGHVSLDVLVSLFVVVYSILVLFSRIDINVIRLTLL
jgi:hypothetical protein